MLPRLRMASLCWMAAVVTFAAAVPMGFSALAGGVPPSLLSPHRSLVAPLRRAPPDGAPRSEA